MLLDAVIIILREVLEAAMLTSVFLAISKTLGLGFYWFVISLVTGILGAYWYALNIGWISGLFDYTGQELFNGSLQIGIYLSAFVTASMMSVGYRGVRHYATVVKVAMAITVTLAVAREGVEILLYMSTFVHDRHKLIRVLIGGVVGASIGASVGIIVYYMLVLNPARRSLLWCHMVLAVVASGILGQAVPLFEQIDILPSTEPLWNTSSIVSETSPVGQLLYAIVGYEATPSRWQVAVYGTGLLLFGVLLWYRFRRGGERVER